MFRTSLTLAIFSLWINSGFTQTKLEKHLTQLEHLRFEAMEQKDLAFLETVLADEVTYGHSNGLMEDRAKHLEHIISADIVYEIMDPLEMDIRTYRKSAVINGLIRVKGQYKGTDFDIKLRYTDVYQKQKRKWKLVAWQSVKVKE